MGKSKNRYCYHIFCFPWGRPWGNHAKCCMDGKRIRWLQIVSQHVPIYIQQFPSYSNHNCKTSSFLRTPAFIFCLPWGRPCGNHAKRCMNEKTIQCLPNPSQHVPIYLEQFSSYSNHKCKKSPFSCTAARIFVSPGDLPATITQYFPWMEIGKTIQCLPNPSQHVPIYLQ